MSVLIDSVHAKEPFFSETRHGKTGILVKIERGSGKNEDDLEFMTFLSIIASP